MTLRPVGPDDAELLLRVYASTRTEELAPVPWSDDQKEAFLRQQFGAQHEYWSSHYDPSDFAVVEVNGAPAGRFYVHRSENEIRLVDVALLPEYRRSGIGTGLIKGLLAEAESRRVPVTIHVEVFNPARTLYERLGFRPVADRGMYILMQRTPEAGEAVS